MFSKTVAAVCPIVMILTCIAGSLTASAQYAPPTAAEKAGVLTSNYVKTGLFTISGDGGNTVLRLSGNGLILVNGNFERNFDELLLRVRKIVDQPIRVVIDTDHFENHTGTNGKFLAAGIQVVAQENAKKYMVAHKASGAALTPPSATYDHDQTLQFGLVQVRLLHFGNAHTDGDTVVYFPDLKAVALGGLYTSTPVPDYASGGSLLGWSQALGDVLKLDFDVAVTDSGTTISRSDVELFKVKIDQLISRATRLVKDGTPKDQFVARLETEGLHVPAEQLYGLYAELASHNTP